MVSMIREHAIPAPRALRASSRELASMPNPSRAMSWRSALLELAFMAYRSSRPKALGIERSSRHRSTMKLSSYR